MTTTVENLQMGQSLLVAVKPTNNPSKVQLEIAEPISQPNPLEAFNEGDPSFSRRKARRAWLLAEVNKLKEIFPDLAGTVDKVVTTGQAITVNKLNPTHPEMGRLRVQVTELTVSEVAAQLERTTSLSVKKNCSYELQNLSKTAKRAGAGGAILTFAGEPIISRSSVVFGQARHNFINADGRIDFVEDMNIGVDLVSTGAVYADKEAVDA